MFAVKPILVVEDDPNDLELTLAAFAEAQLENEVAVARDGVEALDYLLRRGDYSSRPDVNPAVVLLDLKLPKLDGFEVLAAIRENERTRRVPVVLFTSSAEERDLARAYDLGVNAYVVKPIGLAQFTQSVRHLGLFWAGVNEPPPGSVGRR